MRSGLIGARRPLRRQISIARLWAVAQAIVEGRPAPGFAADPVARGIVSRNDPDRRAKDGRSGNHWSVGPRYRATQRTDRCHKKNLLPAVLARPRIDRLTDSESAKSGC